MHMLIWPIHYHDLSKHMCVYVCVCELKIRDGKVVELDYRADNDDGHHCRVVVVLVHLT